MSTLSSRAARSPRRWLSSGAVDYSNGGSIPAVLGGARLKILLISTDKPAQYLVSSAKISQLTQLAGKTIAVSDAAGNSTLILRELLAKNGVAIERCR
jgi:ABC-type nitrate/sulfonate/bicarbonate transport system substrate-binding protein